MNSVSAFISPKVLPYFFSRNLVTSEEFSVVVLMLFGALTGKERGSAYWFGVVSRGRAVLIGEALLPVLFPAKSCTCSFCLKYSMKKIDLMVKCSGSRWL